MMSAWAYAEVNLPNPKSWLGDRWILWVRLPSLFGVSSQTVWEAIEEFIRKECPSIGDLSAFPCFKADHLFEDKLVEPGLSEPDYTSKDGLSIWAWNRPASLRREI